MAGFYTLSNVLFFSCPEDAAELSVPKYLQALEAKALSCGEVVSVLILEHTSSFRNSMVQVQIEAE